jgi:hypothetical protein
MGSLQGTRPPAASTAFDGPERAMIGCQLLLPSWQAEALQAAAGQRGCSVGQLLRQLIDDYTRKRQSP